MKKLIKLAAAALTAFAAAATLAAETEISIGTGRLTSVYYPAGGAICRLVNGTRQAHGIRCSAQSTDGSVHNLSTLRSGEIDLGLVQSDVQYHAYRGGGRLKDEHPFRDLRAVFSLYLEPLTIVARDDAGIKQFDDLKGKRVNIGAPGSGPHATLAVLMKAWGWTKDDLGAVSELTSAEQTKPLCQGELDAVTFMVGHPSGSIRETTNACDSVIVEVSGPVIDKLVEEKVFYEHVTIPGGTYPGNPEDVKTFGVLATLGSSAKTSAETVYELIKAVFENFDDFKKVHPALANLDKKRMVADGLSAPLHPGAVKYYKEAGLM